MPILFLLAALLSLVACGKSTSSSSEPAPEEPGFSSERAPLSSASITSATTVIDSDAVDIGNEDPYESTVTDDSTGKTYKTLTFGIFTWIDENISVKNQSVKSTCYAYDDNNCPIYGRLYMQKNASSLCPTGFRVPTVSDWEYRLDNSVNTLTFGGVCHKRDTLECDGLKDSALYLAYGDSAVLLTRSGKLSAQRSTDNGFYSLRCVKYRSIVYKMYELPDCKEDRSYNYPSVYVVDRDSSYSCYRGQWTDASRYHNCMADEEGRKYLVNDVVYICKGGVWTEATIFDTDTKCTKENLYEEYEMNGLRYACSDDGMVKLSYPATQLGYCSPKIEGRLAEIDSASAYVCDNFSWRKATMNDYYGVCDTSRYGKVVKHKDGKSYICSTKSYWRETTDTEKEIGACTAALEDSVRVTEKYYYYECSYGEWFRIRKDDVLGKCSATNEGDTIQYETSVYKCLENKWQEFNPISRELGFCIKANAGKKGVYHDTVYYCRSNQVSYAWTVANEFELLLGYCEKDSRMQIVNKGNVSYKCSNGNWSYAEENDVLPYCKRVDTTKVVFNGHEYVCDTTALKYNGEWYALTAVDSTLGEYCRTSILEKVVEYKDTVYVCRLDTATKDRKKWQVGTVVDLMKTCGKDNVGRRLFNGVDTTVCIHSRCSEKEKYDYAFDGKDTNACVNYGGYLWAQIVRESIVDSRDAEVYGVVTMGTQKWLNRDLYYIMESSYTGEGYLITDAYLIHETVFDVYYLWKDALGGSNICPKGSHIPSRAEWETLLEFARSLSPTNELAYLFPVDYYGDYRGDNLYRLNFRNRGFVDMDYYPPGNYHLPGNAKNGEIFYWISDPGNSDTTASVIHVDKNLKVEFLNTALKTDAYLVHCIAD